MNRSHSLWPLVLGIVLMATTASRTPTSQKLDIAVKDRANAYASLAASGPLAAIAWGATAKEATDIYVAVSRDGGRTFGGGAAGAGGRALRRGAAAANRADPPRRAHAIDRRDVDGQCIRRYTAALV